MLQSSSRTAAEHVLAILITRLSHGHGHDHGHGHGHGRGHGHGIFIYNGQVTITGHQRDCSRAHATLCVSSCDMSMSPSAAKLRHMSALAGKVFAGTILAGNLEGFSAEKFMSSSFMPILRLWWSVSVTFMRLCGALIRNLLLALTYVQ